jgi:PAS domain S-box-containing protein
VPVFLEQDLWGFLGFDDCTEEREWSTESLTALLMAAGLFGSKLARLEIEERYRTLVEMAVEGIVVHDGIRILDANPGILRTLGYTLDEVIGQGPFDFVAPEDRVASMERVSAGSTDPYEVRLRCKDGTWLPVEFRGQVGRYRNKPVRVVTIRDLTARKLAEESERRLLLEHVARERAEGAAKRAAFLAEASHILTSSFDYYTTLSRFAHLAVPFLGDYCIVDVVEDGSVRRIATAHADPEKEPLVRQLERFPPRDASNPIMRCYRSGQSVLAGPDELTPDAISGDSEHREILAQLAPKFGVFAPMKERGGVLGVITFCSCDPERTYAADELAFAEDIASRAALAIRNAQLFRQAGEATREHDELLAIVVHGLRNPLNTILNAAGLLLDTLATDAPRRWADMIRRAGSHMNRLVQDLLEATKLKQGRLTMEPASQSVDALIGDTVLMLRQLAEARRIRLEIERQDSPLRVRADNARMLQVFSNLVGNALKFTPEGGVVRIGCERIGAEVRFAVTDTGPGIPPDQIPHLFGRYWQADSLDRRGVGLGLSIAQGIVEAHGGRIWVESRRGAGSTFFFTLPVGSDAEP